MDDQQLLVTTFDKPTEITKFMFACSIRVYIYINYIGTATDFKFILILYNIRDNALQRIDFKEI